MKGISVKILPIEGAKITRDESGGFYLEGYANTKNQSDRYGDIPTVFAKLRSYVYELKEYLKNPVLLIDHVNSIDHVAGSMPEIIEDEKGLRFKAKFSDSTLPLIAHARQVYTEGHAKGISIAGRFHYENPDAPNQLTLAEIYEISLVAVPADPDALAAAMEKALKLLKDDAADKQTQASHLHKTKAAIDRWLTDLRNEKLAAKIRSLKDLV